MYAVEEHKFDMAVLVYALGGATLLIVVLISINCWCRKKERSKKKDMESKYLKIMAEIAAGGERAQTAR